MEPIVIHSLPLLPASSRRPQQNPNTGGQSPPGRQPPRDGTADDTDGNATTDGGQEKIQQHGSDGIVGTIIDVEA